MKNNKVYTLILATLIAATPIQSQAGLWNWFTNLKTDKQISFALSATAVIGLIGIKLWNWCNTKKNTTPRKKHITNKILPVQETVSYTGINNPKNDCYLNSVFQALFHTPSFVNEFSNAIENQKIQQLDTVNKALYTTLNNTKLNKKAIDAKEYHSAIKKALNLDEDNIKKQQDAQQALAIILEKTEKLFKKATKSQALSTEYQEIFYNSKQKSATKTNTVNTHHLILKIDKEKINTVQDALDDYFAEETIEEHKQYNKKKFQIKQSPNTLILVLSRSAYDKECKKLTKLKKAITFNNTIKLNGKIYNLANIIVHHGQTLNSGHYTTCTKTHEFNDSIVKQSTDFDTYAEKGIINSTVENKRQYNCSTPYIFCYSLRAQKLT